MKERQGKTHVISERLYPSDSLTHLKENKSLGVNQKVIPHVQYHIQVINFKKRKKKRKEKKKKQAKESCSTSRSALGHPTLRHVQVVIRAQMLDQVVSPREAVQLLARAVLHGTILIDGVVDAGLVAPQVGGAGEGSAAVLAAIGFGRSGGGVR